MQLKIYMIGLFFNCKQFFLDEIDRTSVSRFTCINYLLSLAKGTSV